MRYERILHGLNIAEGMSESRTKVYKEDAKNIEGESSLKIFQTLDVE